MIVTIVLICVLFTVATAAIGWLCFTRGYNLGWRERHAQMIVSRHSIDRLLEHDRQQA
jgi:hypothetical protein